jgi:hypothetical protein
LGNRDLQQVFGRGLRRESQHRCGGRDYNMTQILHALRRPPLVLEFAALPSNETNSRRLMLNLSPSESVHCTLSLPQNPVIWPSTPPPQQLRRRELLEVAGEHIEFARLEILEPQRPMIDLHDANADALVAQNISVLVANAQPDIVGEHGSSTDLAP